MFSFLSSKRRIYLDHASTTPLSDRVSRVISNELSLFGNPSALYKEGVVASTRLQEHRRKLAKMLQVKQGDIFFTSGGTESDVWALRGTVLSFRKKHPAVMPKILVSSIEHAAVLDTAEALSKEGLVEVVRIPVDHQGLIDMDALVRELDGRTALVSVMYVNNEIGTIQPIRKISQVVHEYRKKMGGLYPLMHTDACQAINYLPIDVPRIQVDLMTLNSSKCYGPKGVGALYVRNHMLIEPIITGGGQEGGMRSGTESLFLVAGFVESIIEAQEQYRREAERLSLLRDYGMTKLIETIPGASINGSKEHRIANNISVTISDISSEELVIRLDAVGISVSSKSACSSIDTDGSYVILAIGKTETEARQTLRITLGRSTTKKDIDYLVQKLDYLVNRYRK